MITAVRSVLSTAAAGGLVISGAFLAPAAQARSADQGPAPLVTLRPQAYRPPSVKSMCGARDWKFTENGHYILRNNVFTPSVRQCIWNRGDQNNFTVSRYHRSREGLVGSYPDLFTGCDMWGVCTKDTPLPVKVSRLLRVRENWRTRFPADGQDANDADDIWFTHGKLDGPTSSRAELMIWLTSTHVRAVTIARIWVDHYRWRVAKWITTNGKQDWNYIQFRVAHPRRHVTCLGILPFIRYAEARGWIKPSWDFSSFDAGFEIWDHGRGDGITHYWLGLKIRPR